MRKQLARILCLALLVSFAGFGSAQVSKPGAPAQKAMPAASAVNMTVVDDKGQAVKVETLPKEVQDQIHRVRKAAESVIAGGGTAERVKITIRCSYPPLSCTITISF